MVDWCQLKVMGRRMFFFDDFPDFTLGDFFFSFQPFIFRGVTPILIRFGDVLQYHKNSMLGR